MASVFGMRPRSAVKATARLCAVGAERVGVLAACARERIRARVCAGVCACS